MYDFLTFINSAKHCAIDNIPIDIAYEILEKFPDIFADSRDANYFRTENPVDREMVSFRFCNGKFSSFFTMDTYRNNPIFDYVTNIVDCEEIYFGIVEEETVEIDPEDII